ncbi:hypothetical protein E2C01_040892 [Portunus trituberculatus]|uniref:Uncharacterized protein n=1 Tax=Portunus trituberculatus TaxID=210409 RepID=A0A5B7FNX7_PORTR|nr:hypothetical protein [Portunus trituberculatus]
MHISGRNNTTLEDLPEGPASHRSHRLWLHGTGENTVHRQTQHDNTSPASQDLQRIPCQLAGNTRKL